MKRVFERLCFVYLEVFAQLLFVPQGVDQGRRGYLVWYFDARHDLFESSDEASEGFGLFLGQSVEICFCCSVLDIYRVVFKESRGQFLVAVDRTGFEPLEPAEGLSAEIFYEELTVSGVFLVWGEVGPSHGYGESDHVLTGI